MAKGAVFADVNEAEIEQLQAGGNHAKSTIYRRKSNTEKFDGFCTSYKNTSFDQLIANALETEEGKKDLQDTLKAFFHALRVTDKKTGKQVPPKNSTCKGFKSNIKNYIMEKTGDVLNIYNKNAFPEFAVSIFLNFRFRVSNY